MKASFRTTRWLFPVLLVSALLGSAAFIPATPKGSPVPLEQGTSSNLPATGSYTIDAVHTFVGFGAQHLVVGMIRGSFAKSSGSITIAADPAACEVNVSIEASSINTLNDHRDEDLRGADFFDAAKFPAITYHGKGFRRVGDHWTVDGTLTIRGVAKAVPLEFVFKGTAPKQEGKPDRIAFHASASVKRADFGMTRELLLELGPTPTGPDVWIDIDTEALSTGTSGR